MNPGNLILSIAPMGQEHHIPDLRQTYCPDGAAH